MGTMTKLRENTGVVLWILVIAFGVIWVLQDSGGLDVVGMGGTDVITVNGDAIPLDVYNRAVDAQVQQYQQQTGESMPPQMLERERQRVVDALVEDRLREQEMDRLGITVTDEEIIDMVYGESPHPMIQAYFGDGQGNVDQALLQSFVSNPEARQDWIQIEEYLRQERRAQKLQHLIVSSVRVTDSEVEEEYRNRNRSASARWVGLRYADVPDDQVEVTDRDLRRFYDSNREDFRRERTYTVQYASITKMPTSQDSVLLVQEMERLADQFARTDDEATFLDRHGSLTSYTDTWYQADDLEPELASAIFDQPVVGEIVGPVFSGGNVHLVKILESRSADEPVIRARHILIRSGDDPAAARQQLVEVREEIEDGADFGAMAQRYSQDGTAPSGGDLGWFGRGRMVAPFENAAFDASVGSVVGPVETTFGYHLIEVTDRADQELRLADYSTSVAPDIGTLNQMQERLDDLRYYVEEGGSDFADEAERHGAELETVQIEAGQTVIPGIGESRSLANFLEGSKRGSMSEVIELDDRFIVARVTEIQREGYRPFEEVQNEIRPRVTLEKKREVQVARLQEAVGNSDSPDLDAISAALGTSVQTQSNVMFNTQVITGLGREPKFVGTVAALDEGQTSDVIEGTNGTFIVQVTEVQEPAPITDAQRRTIKQQLENQRQYEVMTQWLTSLREAADVRDNRARLLIE